jgi:iron complex outermembrane receptor protein
MKTHKLSHPVFSKTLLSAVIALSVSGVNAQEENDTHTLEEVLVTAQFRHNLQNALDTKRNASTIVDGISADDIGSLPALDMGEALQAVPGVQVNREGERRESSINLRGLPSGFVLTTANGQGVASPTRSTKAFGAPNPFGAYDPAVFNGVNVIKTQTAAMQEGGIAGTVDLRLARALERPETSLSVQVGARNEVLADEIDPEFVVSGSKHVIEDVLAFTGALAYSKQSFRRDTIKINRYDPLNDANFVDPDGGGQTFADWKTENGLPANAVVEMPGELRQGSEVNRGDRLSFSGGLEFRATDELTLGANIIYTERDMDDNAYEQLELRTYYPEQQITPLSAPRPTGKVNSDGDPIYSITDIGFDHVRYAYDNRQFNLYEQSQAVILDAEWEVNDWTVDGAVTISSSENQWDEILLSPRFDVAPAGQGGGPTGRGTGISGRLYTGEGDISQYLAEVNNPELLDLDNVTWQPRTTVSGSGTVPTAEGPYLLLTGTWENIQRDNNSFEINAERMFDGPLSSIQFGYRFNTEEQDSKRLRNSPAGVDPTGILTGDDLMAPSYTREEAFFGGEAPGFASFDDDGWYSFPIQPTVDELVATINIDQVGADPTTGEEPVRVPTTGFIQRGGQQGAGLVYNTQLDTSALYGMANFDFDIGPFPASGNLGLRYVDSSLDASAPFFDGTGDINNPAVRSVKYDYDYLLPSMNVAVDLREDLKLRLAYGESIVRPNLRSSTPASSMTVGGSSVNIQLPGVEVDPFEGTSYDLSLEWYNRTGSAITFAAFRKEVDSFFAASALCSNEALQGTGYDIGNVSMVGDSCITDGTDGNADPLLIQPGDEVNITQVQNIDNTITVDGFELSVQQNLDFLPYPWNGFGGVLNYSNTSQKTSGDADITIPGISDDTYNVIGYYEQESFGVRLAYNYRTEYELESVGTFNGAGNKSVQSAGRVDLSAYYNVTDDMTVSLKGYNLTDTLYEEYEDVEWQPRATHFDGRVYVLSVKYNFF